MKLIRYIKFKLDWLCWFISPPMKFGDPMYGEGDTRKKNIHLIHQRWAAREPKWP